MVLYYLGSSGDDGMMTREEDEVITEHTLNFREKWDGRWEVR